MEWWSSLEGFLGSNFFQYLLASLIFLIISLFVTRWFIKRLIHNLLASVLEVAKEASKQLESNPQQSQDLLSVILGLLLKYYGFEEFAPLIVSFIKSFLGGIQPKENPKQSSVVWG